MRPQRRPKGDPKDRGRTNEVLRSAREPPCLSRRSRVQRMITVQSWTGTETKALRQAMRLSIRAFAAYLGIDARTVNKWEARHTTITLRPHTQTLMDTALKQAAEDVQTRFTHIVRNSRQEQQENTAQPASPAKHHPHTEPTPGSDSLTSLSGNDGPDPLTTELARDPCITSDPNPRVTC
jgi:transcriptional regulator with XRE-family HTH domain